MLLNIVPALLCITIHELMHGYTAYRLGDPTARNMGRLTLNPIKHIHPIGLIMMVFYGFGWAKPVPVNMRYFRKPKQGMAITAIAGPLSNIALAMVFLVFLRVAAMPLSDMSGQSVDELVLFTLANQTPLSAGGLIFHLLARTVQLNIALAIFNLLPIPPLDGSKVVFSLLPENLYLKLMHYEFFGIILLLVFINTAFFESTVGLFIIIMFLAPLFFFGIISQDFYTEILVLLRS